MVSLELDARLDNLLSTAQAETANIDLYKPIPEREECPICLIPLPIDGEEIIFMTCCGKEICAGCMGKSFITAKAKGKEKPSDMKCAFCCEPSSHNDIKKMKRLMKNNNPLAYNQMALSYESGDGVFQSDTKALEMYIRAAELGNADAYVGIGLYYKEGTAVERDLSKSIDFLEVAAKKGSSTAHRALASHHQINGNIQNLIEHMKVAARAGCQDAMNGLKEAYKDKELSKEDLAQTLRAFQASRDNTKSKDRDYAQALNDMAVRLGID